MTYTYIIAIDPDTAKSGVATLNLIDLQNPILEANTYSFPDLLDYLSHMKDESLRLNYNFIVIVEAGWLIVKSNYHTTRGAAGERTAKNVGSNHEVGRKIIEMCAHWGIPTQLQRPLRKCWQGRDGKITHDELASFIPIAKKTNQETRDAMLIAWHYANLKPETKPSVKLCTGCSQSLPLSAFYVRSNNASYSLCKDCFSNNYYDKNAKKIKRKLLKTPLK